MSGIFSKSSRPKRPGAYFNWLAVQPSDVPPAIGSIVAVGFTHTWGPDSVAVPLSQMGDFADVFGGDASNPSSGYVAVRGAFQGDDEFGGAGTVLAYRMVGSAAAKAAKTIQNIAGTPANALTLTARYNGTFGNRLNVTTQVNSADGTKLDLLTYDGTTLLETWTATRTDVAGLAAAITAGSAWVTATSLVTGTGLAYVANQALTGGNDGATLVSGDYTAAMSDLGTQRFGVLVFENLTDSSIVAALKTWADGLNTAGRRLSVVVGGASDEDASSAIARSGTLNDSDFLNVGVGHVADSGLLDSVGAARLLSTAQAAPRIAGSYAARGERQSMTFAHFGGWTLFNGASDAEVSLCIDAGVIVLTLDSNPDAPVRIESSRTTYTTTTNAAKPYLVYRNPQAVALMHSIEIELTESAEANVVGQPADQETRSAVLARINTVMQRRVDQRAAQPGFTAPVDPVPNPPEADEFVAFEIDFHYGRSAEQVFFSGRIG